jgi:hypothetical protein
MEILNERYAGLTRIVHWTARIWSLASMVLILGFIIGEGLNPSTVNEWIGLLLFPFGISAGMIVAWWKEGLGGSITISCLLIFYLFWQVSTGEFPKGWAWLLFSLPGFIFLLGWYLAGRKKKTGSNAR